MIPAFGWSVSDVIAAIELIRKISKALKATGGAATHYQYVRIELDSLARALRDLTQLDVTEENAQRVDAIRGMALGCRYPLNEFLDKIKKFEGALGPEIKCGAIAAFQAAKRSAQWAKSMEEEIVKLRAYIAPHVASINLLLQVHSHELGYRREQQRQNDHKVLFTQSQEQTKTLGRIQREVDKTNLQDRRDHAQVLTNIASVRSASKSSAAVLADVRKTTDQVAAAISDLSDENRDWFKSIMYANLKNYDAIVSMQQSISLSPTSFTSSNIKFTDALDRHHELPYSYFQDWSIFEAFLKSQFADVPGAAQVAKGHFRISDGRDNQAVMTKSNWSQAVFPGSEVTMAVVLSMIRIEEGKCPRPNCGWRVAFSRLTTADITCPHCGLVYSADLSSRESVIGDEIEQVVQRQNLEDVHNFGSRKRPLDVASDASSSSGNNSDTESDVSPEEQDQIEKVTELREEQLRLLEELAGEEAPQPEETPVAPVPVTAIDWNSGESPMAAWLNQSAIPMPGALPESIEDPTVLDPQLLEQESWDLEKLRKVHLSFAPEVCPGTQEPNDEFKNMDAAAQPYLRKIIDKFPALPPFLARRLAETNLHRKRRLAADRAIRSVIARTGGT